MFAFLILATVSSMTIQGFHMPMPDWALVSLDDDQMEQMTTVSTEYSNEIGESVTPSKAGEEEEEERKEGEGDPSQSPVYPAHAQAVPRRPINEPPMFKRSAIMYPAHAEPASRQLIKEPPLVKRSVMYPSYAKPVPKRVIEEPPLMKRSISMYPPYYEPMSKKEVREPSSIKRNNFYPSHSQQPSPQLLREPPMLKRNAASSRRQQKDRQRLNPFDYLRGGHLRAFLLQSL